jgi:FkbM family methyltransferase
LIDVGANIGLYTLLLRSVSDLPIIAYEPQPFLFKLLRRNVDSNHLANVEARNFACGSRRGEIPFSIGINGSVAAGADAGGSMAYSGSDLESEAHVTQRGKTVVKVPLTTLDEDLVDEQSIALLKIDCEGFEFDILQGALGLIDRNAPELFLEVHPTLLGRFGHSVEDVLTFLKPHYDLEFWCFDQSRWQTKLGRSLAKFRRPRGRRFETEHAMLAAANGEGRPAQIYFVGRSRRKAEVT